MKQSKYTEKQKLARTLDKEREILWKQRSKLGWYVLPTPIQKGWQRRWRIKEDVLRCSEADRFKQILPHIQVVQVSRTTKFDEYTYLGNPADLHLGNIDEHKRKSIEFPEFFWTKYFHFSKDYNRSYRTGIEIKYRQSYKFLRPNILEVEIVPNFLTRLRILDPALESRLKELENKIKKNNLCGIIDKLHFGCCRYRSFYLTEGNTHILRELEKEAWHEIEDAKKSY